MQNLAEDYRRGLGMATRNNALAFGYSVNVTGTFGVLSEAAGRADIGRVFLFLVGCSIAFTAVNALVTRGFRRRVEEEPPVILALATSLSAISISAGVGAAAGIGTALGGWSAWLLGPLAATWAYLSTAALEVVIARAFHMAASDVDPESR